MTIDAKASKLTTNLRVGRSNRSGRATNSGFAHEARTQLEHELEQPEDPPSGGPGSSSIGACAAPSGERTGAPALRPARLTGRCANGAEADGGRRIHLIPEGETWATALCGAKPGRLSSGWSEQRFGAATCPRCLAKDRASRLEKANAFIRIISEHGRRFFHHDGKVDHLELGARGHVYFVSAWNGRRTFTHYPHRWQHFEHGGTLRSLVEALRDYVVGKRPLPVNHLGPWRRELCDGDLWGYGFDEMERVRQRVADELGCRTSKSTHNEIAPDEEGRSTRAVRPGSGREQVRAPQGESHAGARGENRDVDPVRVDEPTSDDGSTGLDTARAPSSVTATAGAGLVEGGGAS